MTGNLYSVADVEREAAFWFARMRSDRVSAGDRRRFEDWLATDPAHADAYNAHELLWDAVRGCAADPVIVTMRAEALALRPEPQERRWTRLGALAASIALFLLFGLAVQQVDPGAPVADRAARIASADPALPSIFRTQKEQRSTVTLADDSVVELNADSMVQVSFTDDRRDVHLLRGQAMFDVAHDSARPFVVEAGDQRIVALGTQFDVRIATNELRVTLIEGRVKVEPRAAGGGDEEVRELTPGEQLVARAARPIVVQPVDAGKATSWRTGKVIFSDEPLSAVIEEINRYSSRQVELADPALGDLRVSGVFRAGSVDSFTSALALTLPIEQRADARRDVIVIDWQ